jgi:hypothetical protein
MTWIDPAAAGTTADFVVISPALLFNVDGMRLANPS